MSGHSKWATIKHKKGALDAKRGKIFTRLIKEITIAARSGGGDPDGNPRLRSAIAAAKAENMPADNIKRAVQRGTGEIPGLQYEEISFEGYGPGGVAVIVDCTTDNRNRAVSEIRHTFSKNGGNLGEPNSVRFMFAKKGVIAVSKDAADEDKLMGIVLDAGGDDLNDEGDTWEIITEPNAWEAWPKAVKDAGIETVMSEVTMVARRTPSSKARLPRSASGCSKRWKTTTTCRTSTRISTWTRSNSKKSPVKPIQRQYNRGRRAGGLSFAERMRIIRMRMKVFCLLTVFCLFGTFSLQAPARSTQTAQRADPPYTACPMTVARGGRAADRSLGVRPLSSRGRGHGQPLGLQLSFRRSARRQGADRPASSRHPARPV